MANQPWKTNDWFVSEWNYAPEVTKDFRFAKNIKIHDVTLRDGEQQTGVILTKDEKIRIAEALAEAGVHRIEAGMPIVSPSDNEAIKEIVKRNLGPQIFSFARCMKEDVSVPSTPASTAWSWRSRPASTWSISPIAGRWKRRLRPRSRLPNTRTITASRSCSSRSISRAELKWALDLIERVGKDGHMDALALVDTFGVVSPHAMRYFVREVQKRIKKRLEAHFHQDFGMGVANTIMALAEGVEVMHTTVLGVGERSGNAPMEEIVMALKTMYGVDVGIDTTKLTSLANLVQRLTGVAVPTNKAIVGSGLYQIESGIIASWFKNCGEKYATELFPIRWSAVGQPPAEVVMGKGSGIDSVNLWLQQLGMQVSEEDALKILAAVKAYSLKNKKMLSHGEFRDLAKSVVKRAAA